MCIDNNCVSLFLGFYTRDALKTTREIHNFASPIVCLCVNVNDIHVTAGLLAIDRQLRYNGRSSIVCGLHSCRSHRPICERIAFSEVDSLLGVYTKLSHRSNTRVVDIFTRYSVLFAVLGAHNHYIKRSEMMFQQNIVAVSSVISSHRVLRQTTLLGMLYGCYCYTLDRMLCEFRVAFIKTYIVLFIGELHLDPVRALHFQHETTRYITFI